MSRVWLIAVLLVAVIAASAHASCSITQNCHVSSLDSNCHSIAFPHDAFKMNYSPGDFGFACPQYKDSTCCNFYQNEYLSFNFLLISSAFSECAACVNNLKEFWCQFTCAPNQADFLHPIALVNVTDPSTKVNTTALQMTLDITPDLACGVFDSCKGTTKCRSVQTMKTCNGFLDYQGQYEAIGRGNYIQFNYTAADTAMNFPPQDCSNFTNSDGTHSSCSCSSCQATCDKAGDTANNLGSLNEQAAVHPLHGANWVVVGVLYASIFVLSCALMFYRYKKAASAKVASQKAPPASTTAYQYLQSTQPPQ